MSGKAKDVRTDVLLWLRTVRVYNRLSRIANKHIKELGLTPAQFDVIAQAGATPGLTQGELADRLFVTEGNITQLLDRMERAGLVERRKESRSNRVMLTAFGKKVYERSVSEHEIWMATQFEVLTTGERKQLSALLRRLERGLRSQVE